MRAPPPPSSKTGTLKLEQLIERLPRPYICPAPEGGVQAEWPIGHNEASLEVNLEDRSGYRHNLNMRTDEDEERELDLRDSGEWAWFNARLRRLAESTNPMSFRAERGI